MKDSVETHLLAVCGSPIARITGYIIYISIPLAHNSVSVQSYGASIKPIFLAEMTLKTTKWVLRRETRRVRADLHIERCTPGRVFGLYFQRRALHVSIGGDVVRMGGFSY